VQSLFGVDQSTLNASGDAVYSVIHSEDAANVVIARLSTEFISLGFGNVDQCIDELLKSIGDFFEVDRAYLYGFSDGYKQMFNIHEWCRQGVPVRVRGKVAGFFGVDSLRRRQWREDQADLLMIVSGLLDRHRLYLAKQAGRDCLKDASGTFRI
jgi:hypothetical protein